MKEINIYLEDINESITKIEKYVKSVKKNDFLNNDELQDAVIRRLAIIGEAARKLPKKFTTTRPEIPWKQIIGMRNILIHVYNEADYESIWNTIKNDIPTLKIQINNLLKNNSAPH